MIGMQAAQLIQFRCRGRIAGFTLLNALGGQLQRAKQNICQLRRAGNVKFRVRHAVNLLLQVANGIVNLGAKQLQVWFIQQYAAVLHARQHRNHRPLNFLC